MPDAKVYSAEELRVGLKVAYEREVTEDDVVAFARLTGDFNPLHIDADYARSSNYQGPIVHGAFQVGLASALLGMHLPGRRVLLGSLNSRFPAHLYFPNPVKVTGEISAWNLQTLGGQLRVIVQEARSSTVTAEILMGFTLREERRSHAVEIVDSSTGKAQDPSRQASKLILLAGASGGLGSQILSALAPDYEVLALVNQHPLDERLSSLPNVQDVRIDISAPGLEERISSITKNRPIYGVIHAAWPGAIRGSLLLSDDDTINKQVAFGTTITVHLARALFDHPHRDGGRFIAMGSTAGTVKPNVQMGVYSLGKASLEHTIKMLAPELARKKITANAVCPSFMPVGINQQANERQIKLESAATPVGRVCEVEDVISMIHYLLSPEAAFVSGQILALTGARL